MASTSDEEQRLSCEYMHVEFGRARGSALAPNMNLPHLKDLVHDPADRITNSITSYKTPHDVFEVGVFLIGACPLKTSIGANCMKSYNQSLSYDFAI